ncbi:MAG TPA: RsmB/NOP family class I SAM-dependent RNA methyltransferase [Caldimonas sp.]|jgi:16S rRNA (cytosine967-C5)-methyltransferase
MHVTALLEAQTELVRRVLRFEHPADRVVTDFFREQRALGARDRRDLADGVFALLRKLALWRYLADLGAGLGPLERRLALASWCGNEGNLDAALGANERVWLQRCREADLASLPEPLRHNLPAWLAEPLQGRLGAEFWPWVDAIDAAAPLDLRVNALKANRADVLAQLASAGIEAAPTPHSSLGIRVTGKPALQRNEAFAQGLVEVQDEGSQLLAQLVGARRGEIVVDFCAGAGGKTLALGAQMRNTGRLYAFDTSGHRLAALQPRLARSGLGNVHPAQISADRDERIERLAGKVDRVLVDAPCSGTGTLRRHPDLKWRQGDASVVALATSQRAILATAARLLKPGGRLVYATCSVLEAEGEDVADDFERASAGAFVRAPALDALGKAKVCGAESLVEGDRMRLWTHRHGTDGFFAALWECA